MLQEAETAVESAFNGRLSRIVMKLFGKVIKTEEASNSPYSSSTMDLEALFCTIEDMMTALNGKDGSGRRTCKDMATALAKSILKFRSSSEIKKTIQDLGIDGSPHGLWSIVLELTPSSPTHSKTLPKQESSLADSPSRSSAQSKDVAQLVSAIGSASTEAERFAAVNVLRGYRGRHGDEDLISHLEKVSNTFGDYIWEQLSQSVATPAPKIDSDEEKELPMSARIRKLRSRLAVTDLATDAPSPASSPAKLARSPITQTSAFTPTRIPTPSRIPKATTPRGDGTSTTVLSLRQRLAAAQSQRTIAADSPERIEEQKEPSHAALLRARLRAVKNQKQDDDSY